MQRAPSRLQTTDDVTSTTGLSAISIATHKSKRKWLRLDIRHHRNVFVTMFYRIWMYRRRHLFLTLIQLLIPPLILVGMNTSAYTGHVHPAQKNWSRFDSLSEENLFTHISGSTKKEGVITCYIHNNDTAFAQSFISELKTKLAVSNITLHMIQNKDEMLKQSIHYHLRGESNKYIAGIEIKNPRNGTYLNHSLGIGDGFTLQFSVSMAQKTPGFHLQQLPLYFDLGNNLPQRYYKLLGIELAVCRTFYNIIQNQTEADNLTFLDRNNETRKRITVEVQPLPYPPHFSYKTEENVKSLEEIVEEEQEDDEGIDSMLATVFVLSMVPAFFTVVQGPVTEKEKGFKIFLQLMGYPRGAYWFSWILNQMIIQSITVGIQVCLIFVPFSPYIKLLVRYGDPTLWYFVLILYNFAALSLIGFLAAFFRRGNMATYIGILIWLLSFHILQSHMPSFDFGSGFSSFMFSCIIPNGCIHWAIFILTTANTNTWDASLKFTVTQESHFRLADVLCMLIGNFFVYFFLTLYVDNLQPGPLESGQPWNYFFESIRCRFIDPNRDYVDDDKGVPCDNSGTKLQQEKEEKETATPTPYMCRVCCRDDCSFQPVIFFQKLSKRYHSSKGPDMIGIDNVNFTVISQRITVLLGHKDSGRTTLFRLLCGEYAPTSGTAVVYGYDVKKDTQKVQSFFSLCTEHNSLCEYLTVMEHMTLIAKLKGLSSEQAKKKSIKILKSLDLLSQSNDSMWKLVQWQRRVLCIAMAFLGNAPILLLDDPTKDLDLDVKRQIWSLLMDFKESGKTILLSTEDIDEAYKIADRIVILSKGRVAGVGAPNKLGSIFEAGYHLTLNVVPAANKEEIAEFLGNQLSTKVKELEGGLNQFKKAIRVTNWDTSQTCLFSSRIKNIDIEQNAEIRSPPPVENKPSSIANYINHFFGPNNEPADADEPYQPKLGVPKRKESDPTVLQLSATHTQEGQAGTLQFRYLLSFDSQAKFPSLFENLDDSNLMIKLGIRNYEVELHSMRVAFAEVDDFADVLDADIDSKFESDFVDIKALMLVDQPSQRLPIHNRNNRNRLSCISSLWALIRKRVNHMIGNYIHASVQIITPIVLLLITIQSINTHFRHRLVSHEINFNASTDASNRMVPYRMGSSQLAKDLRDSFRKVLSTHPNDIHNLKNIGKKPFEESYGSIDKYLDHLYDEIVIAADFSELTDEDNATEQKVKALFSPGHYHSAPLSLLLMHNSILHYEFPNKSYSVEMKGSLMKYDTEWVLLTNSTFYMALESAGIDVLLAVMIAFGYFIFTSGFVTQPCAERLSRQKRYQMYNLRWNGIYWIAAAIVDMFFNIVTIVCLTLVMYYMPDHAVFKNREFIILFVITGTLGGFASTLSSYFWSHFLLKTATSYYAMLSINQFFGLFLFLFYTIINFDYFGEYVRLVVILTLQVIVQPFTLPWNFHFAIKWAINNGRCVVLNTIVRDVMCSKEVDHYKNINKIRGRCCSEDKASWDFKFIWDDKEVFINVSILFFHCILGLLSLMYMESRRLRRKLFHLLYKADEPPKIKNEQDRESIEKEEQFVTEALEGKSRNGIFIVSQVRTSSERRDLLYSASFAVEAGKCTAVVGPETSGITLLYDILSGIRAVSEGNVTYGGHSLLSRGSRKKFLYQLGLCPASDITIDKLTGLQLLQLYGRLRGIPSKELSTHTKYWVEALGLEKVITKLCQNYSVVVKRKLAVALAVIGNPEVVIFDEPTKDLDPLSKVQVCQVLESLINDNRIVLILTHDLSSVEQLCSKLIFLVNGQIQRCGSTETLNKEIENQFTLIVHFMGDELDKIDVKSYAEFKSSIESNIDGISLQEEQSHTLIYRISNEKATWGSLFENVGKIVKNHPELISEYYIRKTSVQDVYDSYAMSQRAFRLRDSSWDHYFTTYY